ncbi:sensor histidine kinase [Rhodococcoides kroppenstedtii]|uniref:hypothetical protein n=1 Tax=Rhodococcoides kroppenstedtii TaxID=293050 RepID=UPI00363CBB4B
MSAQADRRSRLAYQVTIQRVGDYGFRAAVTRLGTLILLALTLIVAGAPWYAWSIVAVALVATYLSASDNYFTDHRSTTPREPLARVSFAYYEATMGRNRPNVPGLAEMMCYVPLGILGPWLLQGEAVLVRLICVAAALVYIGSCLSAVFVDPAFYNPNITMPKFIERVRSCVGPLAAAIAAVVMVTGPWPAGESRWIALGMCVAMIGVQLRLRETDRAVILARGFSDSEQIEGRQAVIDPLHSRVGAPLDALLRYVERNRTTDPDLYDQYLFAVGGYRELVEMDLMADVDVDWPGLLNGRLRQLMGSVAVTHTFTHPQHPLSQTDRRTAHLLLDNFVTNAINADATHCDVVLAYDEGRNQYLASVTDDGAPINDGAWMRQGGGLRRLNDGLAARAGRITYRTNGDGTKCVEAYWTSAVQ